MDPAVLTFGVAAVFVGSVVRGYSGFGSSMIWVSSLSLVLPPAVVVPTAYLLELTASVHLVPKVWSDVDWRSLRWLLAGAFAATPLGLYALVTIPAAPVRVAIAVVVLTTTLLIWRGFTLKSVPGPRSAAITGLVAGLLNGGTGIGGPPAILFYFSSPVPVGVSRASVIAFLFGIDVFAAGVAAVQGLFTLEVLLRTLVLVPPVVIGIALGHRRFIRTDPETFRRFAMLLLAALSVAIFVRAMVGD